MADLRAAFSFYLFDEDPQPRVAVYLQIPVEGHPIPRLKEVPITLQDVSEEDPQARLKELLIQVIEHL